MSNMLAIAHKELKVVLHLADRVCDGRLLRPDLRLLLRQPAELRAQASRFGQTGGPPIDLNDQLIRPLFSNVLVVLLFALPLITMRTYSEEKRSGTIELLLTSPLTDLQIVFGKFLGAMGLIAAMLAITLLHIAILFWYADPEWKPLADHLSRLLPDGRLFRLRRPFVSSLTKNQIVAGMATFGVFLMLWVIDWMGLSWDRQARR